MGYRKSATCLSCQATCGRTILRSKTFSPVSASYHLQRPLDCCLKNSLMVIQSGLFKQRRDASYTEHSPRQNAMAIWNEHSLRLRWKIRSGMRIYIHVSFCASHGYESHQMPATRHEEARHGPPSKPPRAHEQAMPGPGKDSKKLLASSRSAASECYAIPCMQIRQGVARA